MDFLATYVKYHLVKIHHVKTAEHVPRKTTGFPACVHQERMGNFVKIHPVAKFPLTRMTTLGILVRLNHVLMIGFLMIHFSRVILLDT